MRFADGVGGWSWRMKLAYGVGGAYIADNQLIKLFDLGILSQVKIMIMLIHSILSATNINLNLIFVNR